MKVEQSADGKWNVLADDGEVLASAGSNSAAWRELERLEVRKPWTRSKLYHPDGSFARPGKNLSNLDPASPVKLK